MKLGLTALFFMTAFLYAGVGFGGGSSYTALLVMFGAPIALVPIISLACNVTVVSGNTVRYGRAGLITWRKIWPLIILSVPAAWLGGRIEIPESVFLGLLWVALLLAGMRLLFTGPARADPDEIDDLPGWIGAIIGAGIGFYSGMVGIGGGIFLAPVLYALRWGRAKEIAAACSVFILVNSLSGMAGQYMKLSQMNLAADVLPYWPLIPAVLIGGLIGNWLGIVKIPEIWIKRLTGILILTVAARLAITQLMIWF